MFFMYLLLDTAFFLLLLWLAVHWTFPVLDTVSQRLGGVWVNEYTFTMIGSVQGALMAFVFLFSDFLSLCRWLGLTEAKGWHVWWLPC